MEKYSRVLVIIFFLVIANIGLSVYILSKINEPVVSLPVVSPQPVTRNSPQAVPTVLPTPASIQSDLTLIKAEIRALRDSLETNGLISTTPEP